MLFKKETVVYDVITELQLILTKATADIPLTPPTFSLILCVIMDRPIFTSLNLHKLTQFHSLTLTFVI